MSVNADSPASSSPPTSPHDLRHLTSSSNLSPGSRIPASRRNSQLISHSPSSIPSSPTSVHSSSSAIFERDIEPITATSSHHHLHHHPADPHRIARGHNSETLEHSVPSVLDSAAEILTANSLSPANFPGDEEDISIIAPNPVYTSPSSSTSPLSTSRSPSPGSALKPNRTSVLLNLPNILPGPSPNLGAVSLPHIITPPMAITVMNADNFNMVTPTVTDKPSTSISTPTSAYYSLTSSASSSPTTTTLENHPLRSNTVHTASEKAPSPKSTDSPRLRNSSSGSPLPNQGNTSKRLSFLSYTDLLTSAPSSMVPFSSLTTAFSANQTEPPSRSLFIESELDADPERTFDSPQNSLRGRISVTSSGPSGSLPLVGVEGGEWQREGLGRGLEERLEMAVVTPSSASSAVALPVTAGGPGM